jgi:hypothetical protein
MTTDIFCFYLQNSLIQTSQTGGQQYSDTSPLVIPASVDISKTVLHVSKDVLKPCRLNDNLASYYKAIFLSSKASSLSVCLSVCLSLSLSFYFLGFSHYFQYFIFSLFFYFLSLYVSITFSFFSFSLLVWFLSPLFLSYTHTPHPTPHPHLSSLMISFFFFLVPSSFSLNLFL